MVFMIGVANVVKNTPFQMNKFENRILLQSSILSVFNRIEYSNQNIDLILFFPFSLTNIFYIFNFF